MSLLYIVPSTEQIPDPSTCAPCGHLVRRDIPWKYSASDIGEGENTLRVLQSDKESFTHTDEHTYYLQSDGTGTGIPYHLNAISWDAENDAQFGRIRLVFLNNDENPSYIYDNFSDWSFTVDVLDLGTGQTHPNNAALKVWATDLNDFNTHYVREDTLSSDIKQPIGSQQLSGNTALITVKAYDLGVLKEHFDVEITIALPQSGVGQSPDSAIFNYYLGGQYAGLDLMPIYVTFNDLR